MSFLQDHDATQLYTRRHKAKLHNCGWSAEWVIFTHQGFCSLHRGAILQYFSSGISVQQHVSGSVRAFTASLCYSLTSAFLWMKSWCLC